MYSEIKSLLYDSTGGDIPEIRDYVIGLGGKDITLGHISKVYDMIKSDEGKETEWVF